MTAPTFKKGTGSLKTGIVPQAFPSIPRKSVRWFAVIVKGETMEDHIHLPHDHGGCFEKEMENVPKTEDFALAADIFKKLDDSSRLRIFWLLCHCEECVINLSAMVEMSSPAVSHHLKQLKAAGLIVSRREGKEVYYKAASTPTCQVLHMAIERILEINCPKKEA